MASSGILAGRVALVTGAGAGLGAEIARTLARHGARVAVHGRTAAATAEVVAAIEAAGGTAVSVAGDLAGGANALTAIVDEAVQRLGPVSVLVNNAADQRLTPADEQVGQTWRDILEVNLLAVAELTRLVCLRAQAPVDVAVVNVSSVEGLAPFPGHAAYAASKAALLSLTAAAAGEFAPARVNAVAAGLIDRPGLAEQWPAGHHWWSEVTPLRRPVTAAEVAAAVAFLASSAASAVTGATLPVDAGWSTSARTPWGAAAE